MKITAQLALSQMKVNKKRTIAGIFAIALATSLITTVMCFVTSANKMLTDFLGSDYGEYGGAYSLMLAIPALLLGLLIAAMSITVISNIFSASANKRIQEFGILKCVGATGRQIRASVIYESLWLSLTAIPLGLIAGTILGYISVKFTGHFISDINDAAKEIIMRPFTFSLPFHISVWTYLFAGVFSFCIVLFSAYRPAKKVGKFTAIQCVKGIGAGTVLKEIQVKDSFIQKIFGCESAIAYKNMKRNKCGYNATIRALSLGILLFLLTGGLSGQAKEFQEWMTPKSKEMMVDYSSNYDIEVNAKTGKEERKISRPVTSDQYNAITQKLEKYGIDVYGVGANTFTYNALLDKNTLTEDMLQVPKFSDDMDLAEDMIKYIFKYVLDNCPEEMQFFNQFIDKGLLERLNHVITSDFARVTYTDAIKELEKHNDEFEYKVSWGVDLQTEHERYLCEKIFKKPVFVTDYPKDIKAFYMKQNDDGKTVAATDLLVPGIGEIIGGSQREENYDKLLNRMKELNMPISEYDWYLDLRKYGSCNHAGFGLGFERAIMYLTGMQNIRDVIPFPRTPKNCEF